MTTQPEASKHRKFYLINSALGYAFFVLTALALAVARIFHMLPGDLPQLLSSAFSTHLCSTRSI